MRKSQRALINYVTILLLLILIIGGWAGFAFAKAYYSTAQVEELSQSALFSYWRQGPEKIHDEIWQRIQQFPQVILTEDEIEVEKVDNSQIFKIFIQYKYEIVVPFWEKKIMLPLESKIEKDLNLQKSLSF